MQNVFGNVGKKTIETSSIHSKSESATYQKSYWPLLFPDEVRRLDKNAAILIQNNKRPIYLKDILSYYSQNKLIPFLEYSESHDVSFNERPLARPAPELSVNDFLAPTLRFLSRTVSQGLIPRIRGL